VRITLYDYARRSPDLSPKVWSEQWRTLRQQGSSPLNLDTGQRGGRIFPVEITVTYVEYHGRSLAVPAREKANEVLETIVAEHYS